MQKNKTNSATSGFSLVELSIVLLVAGLAMAAITSGAHLMQAARLNKIIAEITGYVTATNNFKDKYKAWPGDMPNATSYWGAATANGGGNEHIGDTGSDLTSEPLRAWQQMSLANIIGGAYTGADAGTPDFVAGTNVPGSSLAGANYFLYYFSAASTSYTVYGTVGNALQLGAVNGTTSPWISIITPADAHVIDVKIDDGVASTGNIYAIPSGVSGAAATSTLCVNNNYASASATYILTDFTASCRVLYWLNKF